MKTQQIGNMTVDTVVDLEGPFADLSYLLPGADPAEIMDAAGDWLAPRFYDHSTGLVVMSFHSLLVRTPHHTILVDSCIGDDKERPDRPDWHRKRGPFIANLAAHGVQPEDIDFVMCSHMHTDHVGWNTKLVDGQWVPTFPNAKHLFARNEFEYWESQNGEAGSGEGPWFDSVLPVVEAGLHVIVDSDHQLDDTFWFEPAEGHTPGSVIFHASDEGEHAIIVGDMFHSAAQLVKPSLSSRFCWDREMSARTRIATVERYADTDTLLLTAHFPTPTAGRIISHRDAFKLQTRE